ncbi:MAG: hypothetical protein JWP29_4842 [Rhodoferax sp.]|nr:hypothetical protein [Rhodoferax sp.]
MTQLSLSMPAVDCLGRRILPGDLVQFIDGASVRVHQVLAGGRFVYGRGITHPCIAVVKVAPSSAPR